MAAIRSRFVSVRARAGAAVRRACTNAATLVALATFAAAGAADARPHLVDAPPVWYDDDAHDVATEPAERSPNILWDGIDDSVGRPLVRAFNPVRAIRRVGSLFGGDHVPAARDINTLDEALNSTWFTNRIGLYPMTPAEVARGPGSGKGPDKSAPWTVVAAKTQGVTPGFNVKDATGAVYVIKFDLPEYDGLTICAGVIASRLAYASGYFTPDDSPVEFRREDLRLGEKVSIKEGGGKKRPMTEADLDAILARVAQTPDGTYRAISSKFLSGKPIGPFNFQGRRKDDPNDRINHEDRRTLRGLRIFSAWVQNFDTKQGNTLDTFVEEDGRHFVRHNLIDFTATLGAGGRGPVARYGHEYTLDFASTSARILTLGLRENGWRRLTRPAGMSEIGYFQTEVFGPYEYEPIQHNSAFDNMTDRDAYWAAKIISAFTDEHIGAVVAEARYRDPAAAAYMAKTLAERRDKLAREIFDRSAPLDFFQADGGVVGFRDIGIERGIYRDEPVKYRARCAAVTADRDAASWSSWVESTRSTIFDLTQTPAVETLAAAPAARYPFVAVECQVDRGDGWSNPITAYVARASQRLVAVDR
ncbi:MAG: hypothetical protein ACKVU1_04055 [bacterium]